MAAASPKPVAALLLRGWRSLVLVLASVNPISEKSRTTNWIRQEQEDTGRIGMADKLTVGSAVTSRIWKWMSQFQKVWGLGLIPCGTLGLKNSNGR